MTDHAVQVYVEALECSRKIEAKLRADCERYQSTNHELREEHFKLAQENQQLRAEKAELLEALKPFGQIDWQEDCCVTVEVGKAARALIAKSEEKP